MRATRPARPTPPIARAALALVLTLLALASVACEPIPTTPGTDRIVLFGDSVPAWMIRDGQAGIDRTRHTLIDGTVAGCDGAANPPKARSRTGEILETTPDCTKGWPVQYPRALSIRPDIAVVMVGPHAMLDHRFDWTWTHPCRAVARTWYREDVAARLTYLKGQTDRVVLVLPPWPGANSIWVMPDDYVKRANCVREEMQHAADQTGTPVVDLATLVCPTGPSTCAPYRVTDGMHIDADQAPAVVAWLLEAVQAPPAPT